MVVSQVMMVLLVAVAALGFLALGRFSVAVADERTDVVDALFISGEWLATIIAAGVALVIGVLVKTGVTLDVVTNGIASSPLAASNLLTFLAGAAALSGVVEIGLPMFAALAGLSVAVVWFIREARMSGSRRRRGKVELVTLVRWLGGFAMLLLLGYWTGLRLSGSDEDPTLRKASSSETGSMSFLVSGIYAVGLVAGLAGLAFLPELRRHAWLGGVLMLLVGAHLWIEGRERE